MSLTRFIRLADSLVDFECDLDANQLPNSSIHGIELHKKELEKIWERTVAAYEQLVQDCENEEYESGEEENAAVDVAARETRQSKRVKEAAAAASEGVESLGNDLARYKSKYRSTYANYCRCQIKLSDRADELKARSNVGQHKEHSSNPPRHSGFHLPPCDVPIFHGDYVSWPAFRDLFTAVFIKHPELLSPSQMLMHLCQKTRGEAREIVSKAPLEDSGFDIAWENLCARFENKRILVNSQLRILFNLPAIQTESCRAIQTLQRDIRSCLSNLQMYKVDISGWDPIIVHICSCRLPESTLTLWEQTLPDKTVVPKWSELDEFLTNRFRTLESVSETKGPSTSSRSNSKPSNTARNIPKPIQTFQNNVSKPRCPMCPKDPHIIRKCPKFTQMNVNQRYTEVKKLQMCVNCFSKKHTLRNCTSKHGCSHCGKRHHTMLHAEDAQPPRFLNSEQNSQGPTSTSRLNPNSAPFQTPSSSIQSTNNSGAGAVQSFFTQSVSGVLLGTAMVTICHAGLRYHVRALIDSGSEGTFISEKLASSLNLPCKRTNAVISGLNNTVSANVQKECEFVLSTVLDEDIEIPLSALVVPQLAGKLPSNSIPISDWEHLPKPYADPHFHKSSKVDLLIGGNLMPLIMIPGLECGILGSLMGQNTIFGWIFTGPISRPSNTVSSSSTKCVSFHSEISLEQQISRFWVVEDLPRKNFLSPDDKFCEDLYVKTTKRNDEGRYIVTLPFKQGFSSTIFLGQSKSISMAQYFRNETRLLRTPDFKKEYDQVLQEYLELGHMSRISNSSKNENSLNYYLPHHAVIKPESTTTKVRVVFNASSSSSNGLSLNDVLHTGPILQNDLTLLLHKWRFYKYVFNSDIQKMYRQILISPEQSRFQRILFRANPNEPIQEFEMNTVTFGVNCAPYLAIRTLLQLASDVSERYPIASKILRESMYVDDVLYGSHSLEMSISARNELILALNSAGFFLRKWTSNSKDILVDIPADHLLHEDFLNFDDSSTAKTLGIRWNAKSDSFYFVTKPLPEKCSFTKREVLSQIAKLFDPAGWLSPCIILAKILMQRIWAEGTDWDESLSSNTLAQWKQFQAEYVFLNEIKIPRWIEFTPTASIQFHGFCDASEKAYAAVLYVRVDDGNSISTHLISAKTKVAPLKTLSIPRLELCGALLLAEMTENILPRLEVSTYTTFLWTDSTIVLSWLAKPPSTWATFVANRVSKIVQLTQSKDWRHVVSEDNPADLASRGVLPRDMVGNDLWWRGPKWLSCPFDSRPQNQINETQDIDLEKKTIRVNFNYFRNFEDILENYSSYPKAMRVTVYILRFLYRTHPKYRSTYRPKSSNVVSSTEVSDARNRLISVCQKVSYPNEYKALSSRQSISSSSSILSLNPFIDEGGLIRSCGRLEATPGLTYGEKHPIILPYNCQFSKLLVRFIHDVSLHGGNQLVLRILRTQFWIPRAKTLIKSIINKCKPCVIYKHRCQIQIMAALPSDRTEITRPFAHTGLDFAGPFDIKNYTGRACLITKGYVCVFVCFATKAIHLEATSDLSTNTFLAAFNRFVARRGCPLHLHSDNGKTFVGASRILFKEFIKTSHDAISSNYAHQNITWHFIPPGAPHMGGLWEAGVKSFKTHFRKIAGQFKYTFEEFSTILSRIEACLNSRPISPQSQEPSDLSALTPGHFLIGTPILAPIDPLTSDSPLSIVNRWQRLKVIYSNFCKRWKKEYLTELHKRHKWHFPQDNLEPDMLVVIREENLPPNSWRLGRIAKVYSGHDGRVRVADVQTQRGLITRPISKLVVLPN